MIIKEREFSQLSLELWRAVQEALFAQRKHKSLKSQGLSDAKASGGRWAGTGESPRRLKALSSLDLPKGAHLATHDIPKGPSCDTGSDSVGQNQDQWMK